MAAVGVAIATVLCVARWAAIERATPVAIAPDVEARDAAAAIVEQRVELIERREAPQEREQPTASVETTPRPDFGHALACLSDSLNQPCFDRASWEAELAATAASLACDAIEPGAAVLRDPSRAAAERIAAAELLHALGAPAQSVDAASLSFLRAEFEQIDEHAVLAASAARALARLGGEAERELLVDTLLTPRSPQQRGAVAWALRGVPSERLLLALPELDDERAELALALIDSWSERSARPARTADALGAIACDPQRSAVLRQRALTALGAAELAPLEPQLVALLRDGESDQRLSEACARALAASASPTALGALATLVGDSQASDRTRLASAEALLDRVPADALGSTDRAIALEHLLATAVEAPDATARRRACFALAGCTRAESAALEGVGAFDPDARVREAACSVVRASALAPQAHE